MKKIFFTFHFSFFTLLLASCVCDDAPQNDNVGNFEALWQVMDEHYCFFNEKTVDWNEVHDRYRPQVVGADKYQLFEVCSNMLAELKDGHVNLFSAWDVGRNWSWKEDYPDNFYENLYKRYMGTDYRIAGGIYYRILDGNVGYVRLPSFSTEPGDGNIDEVLFYLMSCQGLIIDVRDNGGGLISAAEKLAARFTDKEVLVGYMQHKTGKGHNDFSERQSVKIKPGKGIRWHKPVCVLTNRSVYSAANDFCLYMKGIAQSGQCNIKLVGDTTGGGAGMPFSSELPNGWSVRFSACPMYDTTGKSVEHGIAPDIKSEISATDFYNGIDTILETAKTTLSD